MKECITMKDLPPDDRPYERCLKEGPEGLSDIQLLSIIIRTGTKGASSIDLAEKILSRNAPEPGILGLMHLTIPQLMEISGIEKSKRYSSNALVNYPNEFGGQLRKIRFP